MTKSSEVSCEILDMTDVFPTYYRKRKERAMQNPRGALLRKI
jgi:hypothetical protein